MANPQHRAIFGFDVEGPVQAEVFVIFLNAQGLHLTGPCGPAPWYIEVGEDDDPLDTVARMVRGNIGEPIVVHSTSWRRSRDAVVLSFVAVIDESLGTQMERAPLVRADLARNTAAAAPSAVNVAQVVEHGLRHLAWLAKDDPVVATELPDPWREVLAGYVPEPFRNLR